MHQERQINLLVTHGHNTPLPRFFSLTTKIAMAHIATPAFLKSLKQIYRKASGLSTRNLWAIVALVAFSASNKPGAVPHVFHRTLKDLEESKSKAERERDLMQGGSILLVRREMGCSSLVC